MFSQAQLKIGLAQVAVATLITVTRAAPLEISSQNILQPIDSGIFSVGFTLSSSYVAAAIIFEDAQGVLTTQTRVYQPGYLYQQVMTKLSLDTSQHMTPPYNDDGEFWQDWPRQAGRAALRAVGLPASAEVGVLAQAIRHLKSQLESDFSITISEAVIANLHLLALYEEDVVDVAINIGIEDATPRPWGQPMVFESGAAYGGHGFGLCKSWQDRNQTKCWDEELGFPNRNVLCVHYSQNALTVSLVVIQATPYPWEPDYRRTENFTMGSNAISSYLDPEVYWEDVKGVLMDILSTPFASPEMIIVTGDKVDDTFLGVLNDTVFEYMGEVPFLLSENAEVITAMGAAELMRRTRRL